MHQAMLQILILRTLLRINKFLGKFSRQQIHSCLFFHQALYSTATETLFRCSDCIYEVRSQLLAKMSSSLQCAHVNYPFRVTCIIDDMGIRLFLCCFIKLH